MGDRASSASEEFNPIKVSPSRLNALLQCGMAFEMKYLQHLPEERSGPAAMFGSVIHEALEHWSTNRAAPLVPLVRSAWLKVTEGDPVRGFVGAYQELSVKAIKREAAVIQAFNERPANAKIGKVCKAPRMTKDWKESAEANAINNLMAQWLPKLAESKWKFPEPRPGQSHQLPALYDESLVAAKRYEARWKHLPSALYVEFGLDVMWEGFILNCYIDSIEPVLSPAGELQALAVMDYKTYAKEPAPQKDWRQMAMYYFGLQELIATERIELPDVPIMVGMDYFRLTPRPGDVYESRRLWNMTDGDRLKLKHELLKYKAIVEQKLFMPADKSFNADWCAYPENCCLKTAPAEPVDATDIFDQWKAGTP